MRSKRAIFAGLVGCLGLLGASPNLNAETTWHVGQARCEITPMQSVRLSGYASRDESSTGVRDALFARAVVLSDSADATSESMVLVSIDSIGANAAITQQSAQWLEENYGVPRARFVLSSTHSHAAPHLAGGLVNLYRKPSTDKQLAATAAYTERVGQGIQQAVRDAFESRRPAVLSIGDAEATFAVQRRVLKDGTWSGFGVTKSGPVDHRLRVLNISSPEGQTRGAVFLYACHCTTLGGNFNEVSGDWAGLAAQRLEQQYPDSVFIPVIGCGADANPEPRGTYEMANLHAAQIVDGVNTVLASAQRTPLETFPVAHFGYAGLVPEQPNSQQIQQLASTGNPNERRWAEAMQQIQREKGRLPESYPQPIHTWQFGDALTWVFLGGEVVVDYQFRIEREMPTANTWVAAYCDDVFAYVASEEMRPEGGYEVDYSMIYYLQPGRWESGTEDQVVKRVKEIAAGKGTLQEPLSDREATEAIRVPPGYRVELVAGEDHLQDPINVAFGSDGRVWVVEMGDYPLGSDRGGRVKWLRDTDADGRVDQAEVFATGLSYPTSVMPWRDGVLVIAAPDILWIRDTDGDGVGDTRTVMLSGIGEANPQHRASGFEVALDGWLHFGAGHRTKQLTLAATGATFPVHGHDLAWNPATGELRHVAGETQFVRSRDAYGRWFGNSNSYPLFQYVVEPEETAGSRLPLPTRQHLLKPAAAPPVYPRGIQDARFNDQYAAQRFTSACSSIIARVPGIRSQATPQGNLEAFICEPVHHLIARLSVRQDGSTLTGSRHPEDNAFDFFTSTDPFSRPVRVVNAPDGTLWVVDMVRAVIEHPEWIPDSWQASVDLRAGAGQGRIYRVCRTDFQPAYDWSIASDPADCLENLLSKNGVLRDLATWHCKHRHTADTPTKRTFDKQLADPLTAIATEPQQDPGIRCSALGALKAMQALDAELMASIFHSNDRHAVAYLLRSLDEDDLRNPKLREAFLQIPERSLGPEVDLRWLLAATRGLQKEAFPGCRAIAQRSASDPWVAAALTLVGDSVLAEQLFTSTLANLPAESFGSTANRQTAKALQQLWQNMAPKSRIEKGQQAVQRLADAEQAVRAEDVLIVNLGAEELRNSTSPDGKATLKTARTKLASRLLETGSLDERRSLLFLLLKGALFEPTERWEIWHAWLVSSEPSERDAAIGLATKLSDSRTTQALLDAWSLANHAHRNRIAAALLSSRGGLVALLTAVEQGQIHREQLDPSILSRLRNYPDRGLRSRCVAVLGMPTPRSPVIRKYLAEIPHPADRRSDRGRKLYVEHCATCHQATPQRAAIGPPLGALRHWTTEQWLTAILDPDRAIEEKYQARQVVTVDGRAYTGILQSQSSQAIELAIADGSIQHLPSDELLQNEPASTSLMPSGMEEKLTPAQIADVIAYLSSEASP